MAKPELLRESFALTQQLRALREELEDMTSEARKLSERLDSAEKEGYELLILLAHESEATPTVDSAVQQELDRVKSENNMLRREPEILKSMPDTIPSEDVVMLKRRIEELKSKQADKDQKLAQTKDNLASDQKLASTKRSKARVDWTFLNNIIENNRKANTASKAEVVVSPPHKDILAE
ncbi:MAG: hypothetical protein Q9182_005754 [Xanthomendoza sp. 2 TL-2023]